MSDLNPMDARAVARWAAERVWKEDATRILWVRVNLDGPGYMLTDPKSPPRAGLWTQVALIDLEDAMRIAQRGPRGWPALCRLVEKIEEFPPHKR